MRVKKPHTTLKLRLTLLVAVLVLLAAGLVAVVSLVVVERRMIKVIGDQQYAMLSSTAAAIDADLTAKRALLHLLAEQRASEAPLDQAHMQAFLEAHSSLRDEFFNVVAFNPAGTLIASLNDRRAIGTINVAAREYFRATVDAHEGIISRPFKSALSGKAVVLVTQPIFDASGKLLTILAGAIDLDKPRQFGQFIALKPGTSGYLFMLAGDGTILHHPDQRRLLRRVSDDAGGAAPSTLAALKGFEGGTRGLIEAGGEPRSEPRGESRGEPRVDALITYKRLRTTDWVIASVYPVDEALAPLIAMRKDALLASAAVAALAGLLGSLMILRFLRPLRALQRHIANITAGSADISVFDVQRKDEFGQLSRAFFALSQQRAVAEAHLLALARTDALTGIGNRRLFEEALEAAMARAARSKKMLALAYLDIDCFKAINDTFGHGVGDQVLTELAQRLVATVRAIDTVARLAGDEFVIIFEGLANAGEGAVLGQKLVDAMRPRFLCGEQALDVTISAGIALDARGGALAAAFLACADQALYAAKSAGRNAHALVLIDGAPAPARQAC